MSFVFHRSISNEAFIVRHTKSERQRTRKELVAVGRPNAVNRNAAVLSQFFSTVSSRFSFFLSRSFASLCNNSFLSKLIIIITNYFPTVFLIFDDDDDIRIRLVYSSVYSCTNYFRDQTKPMLCTLVDLWNNSSHAQAVDISIFLCLLLYNFRIYSCMCTRVCMCVFVCVCMRVKRETAFNEITEHENARRIEF